MANFLTMYAKLEDAENGSNAFAIPTPSYGSAKQTSTTMVNSARSAYNGEVFGQRVGDRDLVKISIQWKYLTSDQWSALLQKIGSGEDGFYIYIKYFDMSSATWKCRKFYPSDRTATPFKLDHTTKEVTSWLDCAINFIDTGSPEVTIP